MGTNYTVKNGTWTKESDGTVTWSGIKPALVADKAAGLITAGMRIVLKERTVPVGTIISSFAKSAPAGYMLCDGSTFDSSIYTELYSCLGSNILPDLRESTLVGAGTRASGTDRHDVYDVGTYRDDQYASHDHTATVTDNGHTHDPGSMNITGQFGLDDQMAKYAQSAGKLNGAFTDSGERFDYDCVSDEDGHGYVINFNAANTWTGNTGNSKTGISVSNSSSGTGSNTHGKQTGVNWYIAF